ncbi:hypothetical protein [Paracoccus kondratievae]|uniref:Uncharacterized protein n=1 Tax=Paracoccus kondratievae TaxID=135740 RepID=A0AAD3RTC0_9RHOB|nr:hypothetical protein [Paracoccus kondratievae]AZV00270.1 hypothetical protein pkon1_p41 [Paracoccus phage vB_PkoS_Pkon1]GLK63479.1 hypothetical protein GCM10017635_09490 [Paracoccus kondratievae]
MAENWTAIAAEVAASLADAGHTGTLVRATFTGPEWDQQPGPDERTPVKLLGDSIALGLLTGTAIQAGDRRELMAAEGVTPTPADRIEIDGVGYAIIRAEPYAPGGVPLFFDLILRR